jgi:cysteine desulfurase
VTYLPVRRDGLVDLDALKAAIEEKTILVSIMAANNEIGVIQPLAEIGKICRERGVLFHSDAVQAYGKVPLSVQEMNIDLASITRATRSTAEGDRRAVRPPPQPARAPDRPD